MSWAPRPAPDMPEGVVLYDAVCILCAWWFRFVVRRDPGARFRFAPVHHGPGRELAERLGIDPDEPETNAVVIGGVAYMKSDAALMILSSLPGWGWTRALRIVPRWLRDPLYDRVARNRYRVFGKMDACPLPDPALRRHLLPG
ncbi:thiol-disulfide oxidoreductase DCC family protein [Muricoccus radiodurans]|uniref:thiol-disulfide oxidoreductase DCC family protein n=1 Tax=Muricoccus radiodurans TaxID=2231721 RepID=UPI003CEB643B